MQPYMALFLRTSHNRTAFYSLELTMPSNAAPNSTMQYSSPPAGPVSIAGPPFRHGLRLWPSRLVGLNFMQISQRPLQLPL